MRETNIFAHFWTKRKPNYYLRIFASFINIDWNAHFRTICCLVDLEKSLGNNPLIIARKYRQYRTKKKPEILKIFGAKN